MVNIQVEGCVIREWMYDLKLNDIYYTTISCFWTVQYHVNWHCNLANYFFIQVTSYTSIQICCQAAPKWGTDSGVNGWLVGRFKRLTEYFKTRNNLIDLDYYETWVNVEHLLDRSNQLRKKGQYDTLSYSIQTNVINCIQVFRGITQRNMTAILKGGSPLH